MVTCGGVYSGSYAIVGIKHDEMDVTRDDDVKWATAVATNVVEEGRQGTQYYPHGHKQKHSSLLLFCGKTKYNDSPTCNRFNTQ